MDRWELGLGDSLTQRIQDALTASSAILVVLSKNSVSSEWCKRELTAGLVRELEERKTIVMPCVIDDCEIPLFLRDKLYADFRSNPDEAFRLVDRSLAQVSNPLQGRTESPNFFTDFAIDWGAEGDGPMFRLMFVDHGNNLPYVVWSLCEIFCNKNAADDFWADMKNGERDQHIRTVLELLVEDFKQNPLTKKISDNFEKFVAWPLDGPGKRRYVIRFRYRRLGIDNGFDTLVHLDANVRTALERFDDVMKGPLR